MIIGHINEIECLKNCMISSKKIRESIFGTSSIMKKLTFNFKYDIDQDKWKFLADKGMLIKNLKISYDFINSEQLGNFLKLIPNLEEFTCTSSNELMGNVKVELPLLKSLIINGGNISNFIKNAEANNIESLRIKYQILVKNEDLTNFLCTQNRLKELYIASNNRAVESNYELRRINMSNGFPTRKIGHEIKFKLEKLDIMFDYYALPEYSINFLRSQVESLKELNIHCSYNPILIEFIFNNFKNLEKLEVKTYFTGSARDFKLSEILKENLDHLVYYKTNKYIIGDDVIAISQKISNLNSLECGSIISSPATLYKLETLKVFSFDCSENINLILPNLKDFSIHKFNASCSEILRQFFKNIENIENLKIFTFNEAMNLYNRDKLKYLIFETLCKILKNLKNFKTFEYERPPNNISIDFVEKTIKNSHRYEKEQQIFKEVFVDFEFFTDIN